MINFLNFENHIQETQALQETPLNQVIISSPDEVSDLAGIIKDLSQKTLINQIETITGYDENRFLGKIIDVYV